jgi:hypothetical protein
MIFLYFRGPLLVSQLRSELGRAAVDVPPGVVYHSEKDNDYSITIIVIINNDNIIITI